MSGKNLKPYSLRITAFPRIHMTLIGMNSDGYRINGGIGFSITDPKIFLSFHISKTFQLVDSRIFCFNSAEIERLKSRIEKLQSEFRFECSISCEISGLSMTHYGFGTSTATYLSCIEALFILNNRKCDEQLLKDISSRGGTSGIGINAYFKGGLVFDAGIPNHKNDRFEPSSISTNRNRLPLIIKHIKLPHWNLGIAIPNKIKCKSESEEINFFKQTCPIRKNEVEEILYESVYGSLSSIIENNFDIFCLSVKSLQNTKWKKEERSLYNNKIDNIESKLYTAGVKSAGMSSLGPGLYFFSDNLDIVSSNLNKEDFEVILTKFNNDGRIIYYD